VSGAFPPSHLPSLISTVALFTIFNIPIATAQNMGILLFFRLVTGLCGAGFLSVAGGT
jgi:predicted MFS family arabinose efflux permease